MSINTINKFAENVNAKAKLQKVEMGHIALNDLKTLDRMLKESKAILKANEKVSDNDFDAQDKRITLQGIQETDEKNFNKAKQNVNSIKAENLKRQDKADKEAEKSKETYNKSIAKYNDAYDAEVKSNREYQTQEGISSQFNSRFEQAIKSFSAAALALGVKVDISKYKTAANLANRI
tara:strand:- start:2837 stop:3370 length:534 start_codon:yes stop_codon:yes gene_type:complete